MPPDSDDIPDGWTENAREFLLALPNVEVETVNEWEDKVNDFVIKIAEAMAALREEDPAFVADSENPAAVERIQTAWHGIIRQSGMGEKGKACRT